jgi:hypothetical protein
MEMVSNSIYDQMIKIYQEMSADESALKADLQDGNAGAAEKEIGKLERLDNRMEHLSQECPSIAAAMKDVLKNMEGHLHDVMYDVKQGDFTDAKTANGGIQANLGAIFHILMLG